MNAFCIVVVFYRGTHCLTNALSSAGHYGTIPIYIPPPKKKLLNNESTDKHTSFKTELKLAQASFPKNNSGCLETSNFFKWSW